MRKRFWTFWSLLVIVLAISYAWPFAYDLQLTKTVWVQGVVADGGIRFISIEGDSSATVLAEIVFQREKATWRNVFYSARWGKAVHYSGTVDESGTIMDTYRVDIPVLFMFLMMAILLFAKSQMRKRMLLRLIWKELWNPRRDETVLNRLFRRSLFVVSLTMLFGVSIMWISSYFGFSYQWGNFRGEYAKDYYIDFFDDTKSNIDPAIENLTGWMWVFPKIVHNRSTQAPLLQNGRLGVAITKGKLVVHLITDTIAAGTNTQPVDYSFAGFNYSEFISYSSDFQGLKHTICVILPGANTIKYRTISAPLGMILLLLGLWLATMFFRGPVRRANRRAKGLCINCGYNLRGLVQPRCPECGSDFDADILPGAA